MWYHPAALAVGIRDVIGAWLVCLAVAAAFLGWATFGSIREAASMHGNTGVSASLPLPSAIERTQGRG